MQDLNALFFCRIFELSPVGLVIVNKDTTLLKANDYMFSTLGLTPEGVEGKRFGNLFNCAAVRAAGANCGETEQCQDCSLRLGVTAVLDSGVTIPNVVMDHAFFVNGNETKKWFIISASRIVAEERVYAVVSFSDITTMKEYEALLNSQLTLDLATGITNKYALLNALKNLAVVRGSLCVALVDFDDFKSINDAYGHLAGDEVLKIFCACASSNTRKQDILGRFGGEEFMLVFPGVTAGFITVALQRIAASTKKQCRETLGIDVSFSAGGLELKDGDLLDVGTVIAQVDAKLYEAKRKGKNTIVIDGTSQLLD